jgi:hypothetical protein
MPERFHHRASKCKEHGANRVEVDYSHRTTDTMMEDLKKITKQVIGLSKLR